MRNAALAALPLLLAAGPATFTPGLWQLTSTPGAATLNGKPLSDLPYTGPSAPEQVCLTPADTARATETFLTRNLAPGCTVDRRSFANGRIDLAGTCPPQAPGLSGGTTRLTGRWTPTGFDVRFVTTNPSENGVMGVTGAMTGKRIGDCPKP